MYIRVYRTFGSIIGPAHAKNYHSISPNPCRSMQPLSNQKSSSENVPAAAGKVLGPDAAIRPSEREMNHDLRPEKRPPNRCSNQIGSIWCTI
jgi:hypothetical protein